MSLMYGRVANPRVRGGLTHLKNIPTGSSGVGTGIENRPFSSCLVPLFYDESWCTTFHMKMSLHSHPKITNLHMKGCEKERFEKEAQDNSEMAYFFFLSMSAMMFTGYPLDSNAI